MKSMALQNEILDGVYFDFLCLLGFYFDFLCLLARTLFKKSGFFQR